VVASWVDLALKINLNSTICEFSLHLIVNVICCFLYPDSFLFIKLV
jgi:hypothetical protein